MLIAALRAATDRFAADLDAPPNDVLEMSGAWFDFCEELFDLFRQARRLRNEAFAASVRAASPDLLAAHELKAAREFAAKGVAQHRESS